MSVADELEDLFSREREIILGGNIRRLQALAEQKLILFDALATSPPTDANEFRKLRASALRNARLLVAAGRGLKAAIRQVSDAGHQREQGFYDTNGQRKSLVGNAEKLERKI